MALPVSRNTTYAPGSQVLSADLNAIQDLLVNHETRLDAADPFTDETVVYSATIGWCADPADFTRNGTHVLDQAINPSRAWIMPVFARAGTRLSVSVRVIHSVATLGAFNCFLFRHEDLAETEVAEVPSPASAAAQWVDLVTDHAVVANNAYFVSLVPSAPAMFRRIISMKVRQRL